MVVECSVGDERTDGAGKVLLGSDFPNIPYDYEHQLESLERLGLGEEWMQAVTWDHSMRLLGE